MFIHATGDEGHLEAEGVSSTLLKDIHGNDGKEEAVLKSGKESKELEESAGIIAISGKSLLNDELQYYTIQEHHNSLEARHPGQYKTARLVPQSHWWPNLYRDIVKYMKTCHDCQKCSLPS